jgi:hypothetical protein
MQITFDAPHALRSGSHPDKAALRIFERCMKRLRQATPKGPKAALHRSDATQVTFDLPSVFNAGSHPVENAEAIQALLRCLVELNILFLRQYPNTPKLYNSGVVYDRTEVWDSIPALYGRRYGDCKSLSCALVAERFVAGQHAIPVFRWLPNVDVNSPYHVNYHILVMSEFGWEDPSKVCGMTDNENAHFRYSAKRAS